MKSLSLYTDDFFTIKNSNAALEESIERILMTSPGERINNPLFGCILKQSIFNFETYLEEDVKIDIVKAIKKWEPRAKVVDISITEIEQYKYGVSINAINNDNGETIEVSIMLNT